MEQGNNSILSGKTRKNILSLLFGLIAIIILIEPIRWSDAMVVGSIGHTISGVNGNSVNLSNSGTYQVSYTLSGTLDAGDTFRITATDASGSTVIQSYVSPTGGQSSGTLIMNLSNSMTDGSLSLSGIVYTGGLANQVIASGMTRIVSLDTHLPVVTLIGSGMITLSQGATYHESGALWIDTLDGSGLIIVASSGTVNTAIIGDTLLEYWKVDLAGNISSHVFRTVRIVPILDTISPTVSVTSHVNNAIVTGVPLLSGLVSDTGGIANVKVNGTLATLGSGTWSISLTSLLQGANTITVIATDLAGNTGGTSLILNRVSLPSNIGVTLSGTTSAVIVFSTDFSATGVVRFGTIPGSLNMTSTGSSIGTSHSFTLTGLLEDTDYGFTVEGAGGQISAIQYFKTPLVINNSVSGTVTINGPVSLSGSTGTGVIFSGSGSVNLLSTAPSGNTLTFPISGLKILANGGSWDGIISPPERTNTPVSMSLSGYAFTGNAYQIGNAKTELIFSGQLVTVGVDLGTMLSGQTIQIYRSIDRGISYLNYSTCMITAGGDCIFTTDHLSLFAFAMPADTVPDSFTLLAVTNAELSTLYTSNTVTVSGITGQTSVSISGGEYSINGSPFTAISGVVHTGDMITLRLTSSASYGTNTSIILSISGVKGTWNITTKGSENSGGGGGGGGIIIGAGGGGGGGGSSADVCIGGDFSPSNYDRLCMATAGNIITGVVSGSFHIPSVFMNNIGDVKFRDIDTNWARDYILRLVTRGIIDNTTYYRGDDGLTRSEFLKIVIRSTGWDIAGAIPVLPFRDVVSDSWYETYVSVALGKGLIQNARSFRPNDSITRAEATKILMVALGITVSEPSTMTFVDVNKNSDLAKYIEAAKFLHVLSGQMKNGQHIFRPNDSITRSEIAKVVANAFGL